MKRELSGPSTGAMASLSGVLRPFRSLVGAKAVAAGLGAVFWLTAARGVAPAEVGVAAAAISFQTLLGLIASLGVGITAITELPGQPGGRQRTWVLRGLLCVLGGALFAAAVFGVLGAWLSDNLSRTLTDPLGALIFVVGVAAAGLAMVLDETMLGLSRSPVQVLRNSVAASLRFPLLGLFIVLGADGSRAVQVAWVLPILVSLAAAWYRLGLPKAVSEHTFRADIARFRGLALQNYALSISISLASYLLPLAAAIVLTPTENAQFAIAWLIATLVFLPPFLLSTALFSHGARTNSAQFVIDMGRTIPLGIALSVIMIIGSATVGKPVLSIFGGTYADASYVLLVLLTPAVLWLVVKDSIIFRWRIERRHGRAVGFALVGVVTETGGALIGGTIAGAPGLCAGYLAGMAIEIVLLSPMIRQGMRGVRLSWDLRSLTSRAGAS